MIDSRPWFEQFPKLEAWELSRFKARELPATVDQERRAQGQLVVKTELPYTGGSVEVTVAYPSEYPELPPIVYGPKGLLERHQHLFGANFCLLERPLDDWKAKDWGGADLVAEQLVPLLRDSAVGVEAVRENEAPMPEPVSAFFRYAVDAAVLVPENLASPSGQSGIVEIRRVTPHLFVVSGLDGEEGRPALADVFPPTEAIAGKWIRIDTPPSDGEGDATSVGRWVRKHHPGLLAHSVPKKLQGSSRVPAPPAVELVGLCFPEEGPGVGETRDGWMFLCVDRTQSTERTFLFHTQVLSRAEWNRRVPELEGLGDKRVVVIGAGSLGADIAVSLARAGLGHLDIVDFDRFEATNAVRHHLGVDAAGQSKAHATASACLRANPWCTPEPHFLRFGDDLWTQGQSPLELAARLLEAADLVVDASGSHQVAQFIARLASEADIPFVSGWLTDGSWGAEIVRIRPAGTCCWTCFVTRHRAGELPAALYGPPSTVVVQGCSHPTVAGAGFDAVQAGMMIVRLVVSTLEPSGGYPDAPWDYAAVNFRSAASDPEQPYLSTAALRPTPGCTQCQVLAGSTTEQ